MRSKIKNSVFVIALALSVAAIMPVAQVSADDPPQTGSGVGSCNSGPTFFPRWYDNGLCKNGEIVSPNNFGTDTAKSFSKWMTILAMNIVSMLLYVVGYVSLGFIIYGGFKYMISGDTSSGTEAAKKTILNAVIGLVLSIMSVSIVTFVSGAIK